MPSPFLLIVTGAHLLGAPLATLKAESARTNHPTAEPRAALMAAAQSNGRANRARSLQSRGRVQAAGACGVWRCTWPTSGGGCLVWEKTRCKIINPF